MQALYYFLNCISSTKEFKTKKVTTILVMMIMILLRMTIMIVFIVTKLIMLFLMTMIMVVAVWLSRRPAIKHCLNIKFNSSLGR